MTDLTRPAFHGFEQIPLREYAERAYLDYSMYVVLDRALPFLGDGLKPVQRRIVFAMSELGLSAPSKPKKAARTVGDVIGKYHPHGDSACYEALVLMAQPFSFRYPLIEGQGNFGSPDDPKSFAAMRYTEARMTPLAEVLLGEISHGTVDWVPNFDGTLQEPSWLPARLPHLLLNGTTGIAVGMATDIPPHNLNEVVSAAIRLLDDPDATVRDLCEHVRGPDYPTGAEIITPRADLLSMYETGNGSVRVRAVYGREGTGNIVVTALPFQVSPSKILEQIAAQMRAKKLPWLEDLRDESDHENPVRLVLVPRSNRIDVEALMGHLFATTDLEKSHRVNINVIGLDGRPQVKNLRTFLAEWLLFRTDTVVRRLRHRLDKVERRLHLLEGLLVAFLNLDEVIRIIRSEDEPKPVLMARFDLSEDQAEYILETKLKQLARLEEMKIRGEQDELAKERERIEATLGSKAKLKKLIKDELTADAKKHGDARRSALVERGAAQALAETDLVASEPVTVVLSTMGWVRAAKGHDVDAAGLSYREGDRLRHAVRGRSNQQVAFLDSSGRAYSTLAHTLPSARGNGEPLTGRFAPPAGAQVIGMAIGDPDQRFVVASTFGYGFVTRFENFCGNKKAGKQLLNIDAAAGVLVPMPVFDPATDVLATITSAGHLLVFPLSELPELDRGKGNKLVQVPPAKLKSGEERVLAVASVPDGGELTLYCGQRKLVLKWSDLSAYRGARAARGNMLPRGFQRVDAVAPGDRLMVARTPPDPASPAARGRVSRWLLRGLLLLLLLVLLGLLAGWSALRGSLAQLDGEVVLPGLSAAVTIERDALGSATIEAGSAADATRALGYVHAQERFFEMDLMRRSAAGELAAVFGPMALDADRAARMHRLRERAGVALAAEPVRRRALVEAYTAGVNAGLHDLRVRPWPYLLVRGEPQPWQAEDSVLVVLAMFMDLHDQDNLRELGLAQLQRHLDPQVVALLRIDGTDWDAPLFGEPRSAPGLPLPAAQTGTDAPSTPAANGGGTPDTEAPGSNNFAVSGALTDDGRALVADDMHLGLRVPGIWLRARLRYPHPDDPARAMDVSGVTLPGVPGVVAGSNGDIAWGFTNSYGDWVDWVEVEWTDAEHTRYRTAAGEEAAVVHEELIEVAGAGPERLQVVETRWGPVLHDDGDGPALALAWTAHRGGSVDFALADLADARSVDEAVALAKVAGMPAQNLLVGDRSGRIAWTLTGRVPRRTGDCDPQLPLQPLRGCDWDGWVEPADVPALVDPPNQRLWTANARVLEGAALALVGDGGYALGARQQQIRDDLFARERFDEQALLDIQLDDRALFLERWWRLLRDTVEDPALAQDEAIQDLAGASAIWNGRAAIDSASYRLVRAFRIELHEVLYDRLVEPARRAEGEDFVGPRLPQFEGVAWALLQQRPPRLPDGTAVDWPLLLADAARDVVAELKRHGPDLSMRTWGERNTAAIRHPLSGALPGWLATALDMPAQPLPGDTDMPRVQGPGFGASERFVVAPGHEERGLMHLPGGASGHPLSPFHGAGHADWVHGRPTPFLPGPPRHRLLLQPAGA